MKEIDPKYLLSDCTDGCPQLLRPNDFIREIKSKCFSDQYRIFWASLDHYHYKVS